MRHLPSRSKASGTKNRDSLWQPLTACAPICRAASRRRPSMAESDPVFERRVEEALPQAQVQGQAKPSRLKQIVLMASVPVLLVAGAVAYYIANDHYVSTDN